MVIDKDGAPVKPEALTVAGNGQAAQPNALDPLGIGKASLEVWQSLLAHPGGLIEAQTEFASRWMDLAARTWAPPGSKPPPLIEPASNDARFKHP